MRYYKGKREYLRNVKDGEQTLSPTDICPLVRHAWEGSFARKDSSQKAIAERGWGPLNYVLLNHPQLQVASNFANDPTSGESPPESHFHLDENWIHINRNGPAIERTLDQLATRLIHDHGRIKAYEKRKACNEEHKDKYKEIKEIGRLSSGTLTANNHFCLSNKELYLLGLARKEKEVAADKEKEEKKKKRCQLARDQFDKSRELFHTDSSKMKANDFRVLINNTRNNNESPAKKNLAGMKDQFASRDCESRLNNIRYIPVTTTEVSGRGIDHDTELPMVDENDNGSLTGDIINCFNDEWMEDISQDNFTEITKTLFDDGTNKPYI